MPLRELNRWLHTQAPTDGPKTLNGLILETLEEIPEGDVSRADRRRATRSDAQRRPGDPHGQAVQAARARDIEALARLPRCARTSAAVGKPREISAMIEASR